MKKALLLKGATAGGPGVPVRNGLVAEYRFDECRNLLKYSQQFDNAAWAKTDCAIAANDAAAPDGTTTADKVTLTVGAAQSIAATYAVTAATAYTYSVWVKLGTAAAIKYAIYDLTNSADILAATSYAATTSWARYTYTFTTPAGCISISIRPVKDSAQDNGETAYLWGAQLEVGSSATTYVPTTDKQTLMDYSKPRKNLLLPNQANCCEDGSITGFTTANTSTVTADSSEHYIGSYSVKTVTGNVGVAEGLVLSPYQYSLNPTTTYTLSAYVKGTAGETVNLQMIERKDDSTDIGTSTTIITFTGEWVRWSVTRTFGNDGRAAKFQLRTGGTLGITFYVDGLQLEEGSTATAWEAPPNIGIVGSAIGNTTNDPTWTGDGQYLTTDDYDILGGVSEFALSNYTICVVWNPNTADTADVLLSKNTAAATGAGNKGFILAQTATGSGDLTLSQFDSDGGGTLHTISSATTPAASTWHYSVAACDGTTLYLSAGQAAALTAGATTMTAAAANTVKSLYLGRYAHDASGYFAGSIAYIAIYNRKLAQPEIAKNYVFLKSYLKHQRGISLA